MAGDQRELAERLITAEQEERRRLALFLHDGAVQSLAGIALMLDGARHALDDGRVEQAKQVLDSALERHREVIRSLRDLSFNIEPVVLRDAGFGPAVRALAEQHGLAHEVQVDLDVDAAELLSEQAQAALYQVLREGLEQAAGRRPSRIAIRVAELPDGSFETVVRDDGADERRRAAVEAVQERVAPLSGRVRVERPAEGGTLVRVLLPAYTARR